MRTAFLPATTTIRSWLVVTSGAGKSLPLDSLILRALTEPAAWVRAATSELIDGQIPDREHLAMEIATLT
jgi:hypothetical protein